MYHLFLFQTDVPEPVRNVAAFARHAKYALANGSSTAAASWYAEHARANDALARNAWLPSDGISVARTRYDAWSNARISPRHDAWTGPGNDARDDAGLNARAT